MTKMNHLLEFCIILYYYLYAKNILKLLLYKELKNNVSHCMNAFVRVSLFYRSGFMKMIVFDMR